MLAKEMIPLKWDQSWVILCAARPDVQAALSGVEISNLKVVSQFPRQYNGGSRLP